MKERMEENRRITWTTWWRNLHFQTNFVCQKLRILYDSKEIYVGSGEILAVWRKMAFQTGLINYKNPP